VIRKWIGLILKWVVAVALAPVVWTMARSFTASLNSGETSVAPRLVAFVQGIGLYLALHVAFWKPKPIYLFGHRLLQQLFQAMLGSHVSTIPQGAMAQGSEVPAKPKGKGAGSQGQVLAAVSPALIPVYTILVSAGLGLVRLWTPLILSELLIAAALGASLAFHLLMAIETIQETRQQQTFVAYLITLEFITLATVIITTLCFAFLVTDLSVGSFLQQAFQETVAIYTAILNELLY